MSIPKITYCIPSKSNLRYLKGAVNSIRKNASRPDHDIVVYVDSDEDGTVEWLDKNAESLQLTVLINPNLGVSLRGIGKAYDDCVEASTTEVFTIFHADMILGKHADKKAYDLLEKGKVIVSTRIEPSDSGHPNNGEKIMMPFGLYPEEFNEEKFNEFVEETLDTDKTTKGIFAPWMMYKSDFQAIGGHDPRMHSCREDSDVFNRMQMAGYEFIQTWNSMVYHYTGRGAGSFGAADTEADRKRHEDWKRAMNISTREFIRKWKSGVKHSALMEPIIAPIYNTGIRITNAHPQLLATLEPWAHDIYVDCDYNVYVDQEQPNTIDILPIKIHPLSDETGNDIVIDIDGRTFTQQDFQFLHEIGSIIKQSGRIGRSKVGNLILTINKMEEKQQELINL